ncbi:MAG: hypothetical protein ACYC6C_06635 [Coriobacteriia bacterium]
MRKGKWIYVLLAVFLIFGIAGCDGAADDDGDDDNGSTEQTSTSDPTELIEAWAESLHSKPVTFAAERTPCASCHDGRAFAENVDDPSQLEAGPVGPYVTPTDCRACHTGRGKEVMLAGSTDAVPTAEGSVEGGKGALCMECHNQFGEPDINDPERGYPHYGPQADVLNGTGGMTEGLTLVSTKDHQEIEDTCVACHMSGEQSHSFLPNEAACEECHENFTSAEDIIADADYDGNGQAEAFVTEVEGLMNALETAINETAESTEFAAQSGSIIFKSNDTTMTTVPTPAYMGAYNWELIDHDSSRGIHNPFFTVSLLQETYREMTGAAIPNAQPPTADKDD